MDGHGLGHRLADLAGDPHGDVVTRTGSFADDGELVGTEPGHGVGRTDGTAETLGQHGQDPVAQHVAMALVDQREAVKIDEQQGDAAAAA